MKLLVKCLLLQSLRVRLLYIHIRDVFDNILKLFIADMFINVYLISGIFFLPRDQQHDRPTKKTNYEGLAYLGGYALAWAACLANETIYNILLVKVLCFY